MCKYNHALIAQTAINIKVSGRHAWGKAAEVIALIRRERARGLKVTADQYPYTASSTSLAAMVVPARYREGSAKDFLKRLDQKVTIQISHHQEGEPYQQVTFAS